MDELSPGIPIDRYTLLEELDGGGMAEVFLGRGSGPAGFRRLLVLKRIRPSLAQDPELLEAFREEARISALLRHPNIIQVHDLVEVEGIPCMVMEFVHGRVLSDLAQRGAQRGRPLSFVESAGMLVPALAGLGHAHELRDRWGEPMGLVHRDLSPQNIMVGFDGQVRIFDFGIAQVSSKQPRQRTGILAGKYAYLSPEQAQGRDLDARSDLFGMGVILYEIITQSRLFKREGEILTLKAVTQEPIPPPRSRGPEIPEELERIALKALQRDPESRYSSARDMADDLRAWLSTNGAPWDASVLARAMVELFEEEMEQELSEHRKILHVPDLARRLGPAGQPLQPRPAVLSSEPQDHDPPAVRSRQAAGEAPAQGVDLLRSSTTSHEPASVGQAGPLQSMSWARSMLVAGCSALLMVLAAYLLMLLLSPG